MAAFSVEHTKKGVLREQICMDRVTVGTFCRKVADHCGLANSEVMPLPDGNLRPAL